MPTRNSSAVWEGNLKDGKGTMKLGSGAYEGAYTFASRFENGKGTNPEELIGAAHAGCFSMALASGLAKSGHDPKRISTTARVTLTKGDAGFRITAIELETEASVPGLEKNDLQKHAEDAKKNCPVSRALSEDISVSVQAKLIS
jgi:lipoyl-dependent peroxiredoxin